MIDGNWVDICTLLVGFFAVFIKPFLRWRAGNPVVWIHRDAINDFLNGAVIFPFALLFLSVFSTTIMAELVKHAKISLGLAGAIGVLYVAKEICIVGSEYAAQTTVGAQQITVPVTEDNHNQQH